MLESEINFAKSETRDIKGIWGKIKNRDFRGNEGQAIKNSMYHLPTLLIAKIGSLLFTIVVARLLLPELYGLYTLVLSTITLFSVFSDMGIGTALLTFGSKALGKNKPEKAKAYFKYLLKFKILLALMSSTAILISAHYLSNTYYNKPLFLALLTGALYIPIISLLGVIETGFRATNNFKVPLIKETLFQLLRLFLVPLTIIHFLSKITSKEVQLVMIFLALVLSYLFIFLYLIISARRLTFLKSPRQELTKSEKNKLKRFIFPLTITAFSGLFFGFIDTLMLGHFVESIFIGYYGVALNLSASAATIIAFASTAIFPIFAKLKGKALERGFRKTLSLTLLISGGGAIFTFFIAPFAILLVYASPYLPATPILYLFSLLVIILPITAVYDSYFVSQKQTKLIAQLLVISTILNVSLNYFFITYGLNFGMMQAVFGASIATLISKIFYLGGLVFYKSKIKK